MIREAEEIESPDKQLTEKLRTLEQQNHELFMKLSQQKAKCAELQGSFPVRRFGSVTSEETGDNLLAELKALDLSRMSHSKGPPVPFTPIVSVTKVEKDKVHDFEEIEMEEKAKALKEEVRKVEDNLANLEKRINEH